MLRQCKWLQKRDVEDIERICSSTVTVSFDTLYGQASEVCTQICKQWAPKICIFSECQANQKLFLGDGLCDGDQYNTAECNYDGGYCSELNFQYSGSNCNVPSPYFLAKEVAL